MTPIDFTNVRVATALEEVAAEREKQRAKWGDDHDDGHADGAIGAAAAFLAWPDGYEANPGDADKCCIPTPSWAYDLLTRWQDHRRRQLIIAAALLIAEIERLDRLNERENE